MRSMWRIGGKDLANSVLNVVQSASYSEDSRLCQIEG